MGDHLLRKAIPLALLAELIYLKAIPLASLAELIYLKAIPLASLAELLGSNDASLGSLPVSQYFCRLAPKVQSAKTNGG